MTDTAHSSDIVRLGQVVRVIVPTGEDMHAAGRAFARILRSQDVVLLSGPLGAGKTTFAQGVGLGLCTDRPVVSPTFTIARELDGTFADGTPAHLVHVDAYRIGGVMRLPGDDARDALLDELESLGLDEELDDPSEGTVVLMEWGEHMAGILSDERCEVDVHRGEGTGAVSGTGTGTVSGGDTVSGTVTAHEDGNDEGTGTGGLSADGPRELVITGRGRRWQDRLPALAQAMREAGLETVMEETASQSREETAPKGAVAAHRTTGRITRRTEDGETR